MRRAPERRASTSNDADSDTVGGAICLECLVLVLPSLPTTTRMDRLRASTQAAHARIEAALPLMSPSLTRETYLGLLEGFFGFHAPIEPALLSLVFANDAVFAEDDRRKVPLLLADLCALGRTAAEVAALPRCADLPCVTSLSQALGVLYVLEGATLGGRIIVRHLHERLALGPTTGAAFFGGYGDRTGSMWKRFCLHVDASLLVDTEEAVSAAVETFDKLLVWVAAPPARTA
ncbi:MAG: bphO [Labilithrix sp.]|nr:bphO [Labilithrix sp.]